MAQISIEDPTVTINGQIVNIVSGSFKYTEGFGERVARTHTSGGSSTETIFSENATTQRSKVMFDIYTTDVNVVNHREWLKSLDQNQVTWVDNKTGTSRTFDQAIVTSDAEVNPGPEGEFTVEFESQKAA